MTPLTTEDFPYTVGYVTQLLNVDEAELMGFVRALSLSPKADTRSGTLIFSYHETEILRKAFEMSRRGETVQAIAKHFGSDVSLSNPNGAKIDPALAKPSAPAAFGNQMSQQAKAPQAQQSQQHPLQKPHPLHAQNGHASGQLRNAGQDNLAMVVEAVSTAKEGILKDMSRLLDDKLAGLDEVVVELIRCKSENDALKQRNKLLLSEKEALQEELASFKSTGFGFFRKV